eukprot:scaffold9441_cov49-Attheya_sp.AAC.1
MMMIRPPYSTTRSKRKANRYSISEPVAEDRSKVAAEIDGLPLSDDGYSYARASVSRQVGYVAYYSRALYNAPVELGGSVQCSGRAAVLSRGGCYNCTFVRWDCHGGRRFGPAEKSYKLV